MSLPWHTTLEPGDSLFEAEDQAVFQSTETPDTDQYIEAVDEVQDKNKFLSCRPEQPTTSATEPHPNEKYDLNNDVLAILSDDSSNWPIDLRW